MWVLNFHTQVLMKMEGELTDHELEFHSIDEKVQAGFCHVDEDLEALDSQINHCRLECE